MKHFKKNILAAAVLSAGISGYATAGEAIELSDNLTLNWKGTATYSLGARLEDQDSNLTSSGNMNFDQGDLISNGLAVLVETHLTNGSSGLVVSGNIFYDDVYRDDKFWDTTREYHGANARLLDLYAYTTFMVGDSYTDLRVGSHVVAWGEGLFFPSISLAQGPADAIKSTTPGAEVKEILLPEDQISFQTEITPNWSVMGHYQFDWHPTTVSEPGSFWSTSELVGNGAYCIVPLPNGGCAMGPRAADSRPDDNGQWGIGTRYRISENTELGFYYLDYNDRIPLTDLAYDYSQYRIKYAENVKLYGATFTTTTGINSFAGEITYKEGAPILIGGGTIASTSDVLQTTINAITNFGRTSFTENATLTSELSYVDIRNVDGKSSYTDTVGFTYSDESFWGNYGLAFAANLNLSFPGITEDWDLSVPLSYSRQISGRTLTGGVGAEGEEKFGIGATFTHPRTGIQVLLKYAGFKGDPGSDDPTKQSSNTDRDNISLSVKYAF